MKGYKNYRVRVVKESMGQGIRVGKGTLMVVFIASFVSVCLYERLAYGRAQKDTIDLCLECHQTTGEAINKGKAHLPVKEKGCTSCHNPHASRHPGLLNYTLSELCYRCHEQGRGFSGPVVHKPVAEGHCLGCHEPHSSVNKALLTKAGEDVCFGCHRQEEVVSKKVVHPEVKKGNCTVCHSPHSADKEGLLVKDKKGLCSGCHKGEEATFIKVHDNYQVAGSNCLSCHSPHSSDRKGILKANLHKPFEERRCAICHSQGSKETIKVGTAICMDCHSDSMDGFNKINNHLLAGEGGDVCSNCHNPHASDGKHFLKDKEDRVCFGCHIDTRWHMAKGNSKHPKLEGCSNCHTSHGSNNQFFLTKGDDTCSIGDCHPAQGRFTHPIGEKVIDPRSKEPMSCSTCHNPMGAEERFILRFEKDKELCIQCHQM